MANLTNLKYELLQSLYASVKFPVSSKDTIDFILKYEKIIQFINYQEICQLVVDENEVAEYIRASNRFFSETANPDDYNTPEQITADFISGAGELYFQNADMIIKEFLESSKDVEFECSLEELTQGYNNLRISLNI